jgi:probable rRNA maturation factor
MNTPAIMNRQRAIRVNLAWLRKAGAAAMEACLSLPGGGPAALRVLDEIEVAIISDAAIAKVHVDFMAVAGATDVITFDHGEILVSAETASVCAKEHGHSVDEELALYIIHGILHLAGYDDMTPADRRAMHAVQNRIWREIRAALPPG